MTESHVRYGVPARFDDRLRLHLRCVDVRGARFRYEYLLEQRMGGDELQVQLRPTRIPAWLVQAISAAESRSSSAASSPPAS